MNMDVDKGSVDFTGLFARCRTDVSHVLERMVPTAEVDDLLQEVFVKAARALPTFRGESDAATWLHRIARNVALDHLRSRRHNEAGQTVSLQAPDEESAVESALVAPAVGAGNLERLEMHGCIREFLDRLPGDYRTVIELKDFTGLTNPEIATRLGISLDAAKIRLHRARAALRALLAESCEFYQSDLGTLSCDRRQNAFVSVDGSISSKEIQPENTAGSGGDSGLNSKLEYNMSSPSSSSCGCAGSETCEPESSQATSLLSAQVAEFVAIGAAIGANCEPCLRFHVREALKVGISCSDIDKAVALAARVKEAPARNILKLAERLTQQGETAESSSETSGCCGT